MDRIHAASHVRIQREINRPQQHLAAPWLGNFGFSELEVVWRRLAAWAGGKENLPVDCRDPLSVRILGLSIHSLLSGIQTICLVLN